MAEFGGCNLSSSEFILSVEDLSVGYHEVLVSKINLDVKVGEIIAIVGPSGIGKTTILRTIAGLIKPLDGLVNCNASKRGGIGYIPQKLGLVRHTSVYHNVDLEQEQVRNYGLKYQPGSNVDIQGLLMR